MNNRRKVLAEWVIAIFLLGLLIFMSVGLQAAIDKPGGGLGSSDAAGWMQAIASFAAIGGAIFVMSQQNAHATRLLLDADNRAIDRRISAVSAIVERAHAQIPNVFHTIAATFISNNEQLSRAAIRTGQHVLMEAQKIVRSIPAHELGSYEMVAGLHKTLEVLSNFDKTAEIWLSAEQLPSALDVMASFDLLEQVRNKAIEQFTIGAIELRGN